MYAIAQLKFTDRVAYDRYQSEFLGIFAQFRGTLLAADEHAEVVEEASGVEKVVLMSFPDRTAFIAWAESADYRHISVNRHAGADTVVFLIAALPSASNLFMGNTSHEAAAMAERKLLW